MIVVPTDFPNVMEYFSQLMKIWKECSYLFHSWNWRSGLLPSSSKSRPVELLAGHSVDASIIKLGQLAFNFLRDLKVDSYQSNLRVMLYFILKLLYFINFTTSFVDGILRWTIRVIITYFNVCNTTTFETYKVIFTQWKHLESRVNVLWYCFLVMKQYIFNYWTKLALILGNQSSYEILHLF